MIVVSRRGGRGEIKILFISKATLKAALTEHLFLKNRVGKTPLHIVEILFDHLIRATNEGEIMSADGLASPLLAHSAYVTILLSTSMKGVED